MRRVHSPLPFTNRRLRRTIARLLLTVPTLSLAACEPEDDGCRPGSYESSTTLNINLPDGSEPNSSNCMKLCEMNVRETVIGCSVAPAPDGGTGSVVTYCRYTAYSECLSDGRHPEGLQAGRVEAGCALGALFAQMAWLEAASVPAFLRLADELKAHGAPEALVRAARRSAGDEVRHARAAEALARRHGAAVPQVELAPFSERSLEAMVLENAREGCIRETYGAVVAGWQARNARDEQVRAELARIAEDELRHAELAWAVDAWAAERLSPEARQRVHAARLEAYRELERAVAKEEREDVLVLQAGLPPRDAALRLLQGLQVLVA